MAEQTANVVNLGSQRVTAAVFTPTSDGGLILDAMQSSELMGDPSVDGTQAGQIKMALSELAPGLKLKGKAVRYAISSHPVFIRFVNLPPLDAEQVDQIIEFEAQQNVPFPINEVVWDSQLVGVEDEPEVGVGLFAIKSDELTEINDAVAGAGLKTEGVEVAPVSLFNAFRFNYADLQERTVVLIDIGARTTNLIYVEGVKIFIRTLKIGGADLTKAIAKEFNVTFMEAEQRKIADGFVALGGPYAEHEDPVIAGISKVIRNSLTRLHSEVVRTNNFYRSQQGGSAPDLVLLCGGTAGLPYIREFFAEKLNLPIDHFNAFRNVRAGKGVSQETLSAQAHSMGEIVGLALRSAAPCPVQIDLVPEAVADQRDIKARRPYLIAAGVTLVAMLGALGFYFSRAADLADEAALGREDELATLKDFSTKINAQKTELEKLTQLKEPYAEAAFGRAVWLYILKDLNNRMTSDLMWLTSLEPMSGGEPVLESLYQGKKFVAPTPDIPDTTTTAGAGPTGLIDRIRLSGLYREKPEVVNQYVEALKQSPYFDLKDLDPRDILKEFESGAGGEKHAWRFVLELPLPPGNRITYLQQ